MMGWFTQKNSQKNVNIEKIKTKVQQFEGERNKVLASGDIAALEEFYNVIDQFKNEIVEQQKTNRKKGRLFGASSALQTREKVRMDALLKINNMMDMISDKKVELLERVAQPPAATSNNLRVNSARTNFRPSNNSQNTGDPTDPIDYPPHTPSQIEEDYGKVVQTLFKHIDISIFGGLPLLDDTIIEGKLFNYQDAPHIEPTKMVYNGKLIDSELYAGKDIMLGEEEEGGYHYKVLSPEQIVDHTARNSDNINPSATPPPITDPTFNTLRSDKIDIIINGKTITLTVGDWISVDILVGVSNGVAKYTTAYCRIDGFAKKDSESNVIDTIYVHRPPPPGIAEGTEHQYSNRTIPLTNESLRTVSGQFGADWKTIKLLAVNPGNTEPIIGRTVGGSRKKRSTRRRHPRKKCKSQRNQRKSRK